MDSKAAKKRLACLATPAIPIYKGLVLKQESLSAYIAEHCYVYSTLCSDDV